MYYIYPNIWYNPKYKEYTKLSTEIDENSIYECYPITLAGNLMRYEIFIDNKSNFKRAIEPPANLFAHLYRIDEENKRVTLLPNKCYWYNYADYDIMGALQQLNAENEYAIYHNIAIKRSLITEIKYFPEVPNNFYHANKDINRENADRIFSNGLETPVLIIYWKNQNSKQTRSIVELTTSIEEAEKIFNMKIEIMPNPNKKNEDILSR